MKTLKVLAAAAILGVVVLLLFIYSGIYNVAATEPHTGFIYWVFNTTMKNSVQSRADQVEVPPLSDPSLMKKGFMHYRETCVTCHGAPGVKPSGIGKGLMPEPPDLAKSAENWTPAELYWIIKHGIKMTGMPEWGSAHKEEDLWALAAFVKRLPELSPEQYQTMEQEAGYKGQRTRAGQNH